MAAEWYCKIAGREVGPLSPHQLKTMAERGQILPDDGVRRGPRGEWIAAKDVGGLLPASASPPPVVGPPIPDVARAGDVPQPPPAPPPATSPLPPPVVRTTADAPDAASIRIVTKPSESDLDAVLPRLKRRREQQIKMIGVLLGSILILGVVVVFMMSGDATGEKHGLSGLADRAKEKDRRQPASEKSAAKKPIHQSSKALEEQEGVVSLDEPVKTERKSIDEILGVKTAKPSGQPDDIKPEEQSVEPADGPAEARPDKPIEKAAAKPIEKPALDDKWVDASTHAAVVGFITVQIVSAEIVPSLDKAADSPPRLIITVKLRNGGGRDVEFQGWTRGGVARDAKLLDDAGKSHSPKAVGRAPLPGRRPPLTLSPSDEAREELAFEAPPRESEYVLLELPAAAFGGNATVRMKIPAGMITDRPRKEPPRQPKPGTPEYDFGIPEVDEAIQ